MAGANACMRQFGYICHAVRQAMSGETMMSKRRRRRDEASRCTLNLDVSVLPPRRDLNFR
jgi:hypothetical protein